MTTAPMTPVFDGHNDVLLRLWTSTEPNPAERFCQGESVGDIDLPRAKIGGLAGGLCAIYVPSPSKELNAEGNFETPEHSTALNTTLGMAAILTKIETASKGDFRICRSASDIRQSMDAGAFAAVFHIEGVEAISDSLDELYVMHQAGLRSIGPVWSRPNIFAFGVPFRFNSTPDIGPGLSDVGQRLIKACNGLKVMIDLSHMNEKGFWDVAKLSDAPLVASHSNAHGVCAHSRNLTDKQMDAIRDTGGLAGLNFGVAFLHSEGVRDVNLPLSEMIRHIDYMVERMGIDHVALGSDFDGTTISNEIGDATGLPKLINALRDHGYDQESINKIAHENWIRVLERTWGS